jgi:hypothetical protein
MVSELESQIREAALMIFFQIQLVALLDGQAAHH